MNAQDREMLERLEEELWREETRFDPHRMNEVIGPDFFEFGRSGRVYAREDTLSVPRQPIEVVFPLPGFTVRLLHPDIAQVTYNSAVTYDGVVQHARRSSIWSRTSDGWVLRFHQGTPYSVSSNPLLHHISFGVRDLALSGAFYDAALGALGFRRVFAEETAIGYGLEEGKDKFCLKLRHNAHPPGAGSHLAFTAPSRDAVRAFHESALRVGGSDDGTPGLRPHYGPTYYAAFLIDPDGHRIEAVCKA